MLISASGNPLPPAGMKERLAEIDPLLDVIWHPIGRWAIVLGWPQSDPRWRLVQEGKEDRRHAFDALCYLPSDCSADQAYSYVVRSFKSLQGRDDTKQLLERVHLYNKQQKQAVMQQEVELAEEMFDASKRTLFKNEGKETSRFFVTEPGKIGKPKILLE